MSRFLGLMSLLFFVVSLFTAIRSRYLAQYAGGLARQYRIHHALGMVTGLAIIVHIVWEMAQVPNSSLLAMLLSDDPGLIAAWLVVLLLVPAFVFSFQETMAFRIWRGWHALFPLALAVASLHIFLFMQDNGLDRLIIFASFSAASAGGLAVAISTYWPPFARAFKIIKLQIVSAGVWELVLEPSEKFKAQRAFRAGQIVYLRFLQSGFSHALHPFSVASCYLEPHLRLYVKSQGRDTAHLHDLNAGALVQLVGPFVELKPDLSQAQIWVAGGIGIAPFLGLLHCMDYINFPSVQVLHFVSSAGARVNTQELEDIRGRHPNLSWHETLSPSGAAPSLDELDRYLESRPAAQILICGPKPFMRLVRRHLGAKGVPSKQIITEEFLP